MTNKTISPIRVAMTCDQDFFKFDAGYLIAHGEDGVSIRDLSQRQIDNRTYEYSQGVTALDPRITSRVWYRDRIHSWYSV
jgi:hypothetical protein